MFGEILTCLTSCFYNALSTFKLNLQNKKNNNQLIINGHKIYKIII